MSTVLLVLVNPGFVLLLNRGYFEKDPKPKPPEAPKNYLGEIWKKKKIQKRQKEKNPSFKCKKRPGIKEKVPWTEILRSLVGTKKLKGEDDFSFGNARFFAKKILLKKTNFSRKYLCTIEIAR